MKRALPIVFVIFASCLAASSCRKPIVQCDYRLTVMWQERKAEKEPQPLTTAKVYAFFADPDQWEVTSIEDARAGIITAVGNASAERSYDMEGLPGGANRNEFSFVFTTDPVMLLVVDTKYDMWATGDANVVPDLRNMYVTLQFNPLSWKDEVDTEPIVKKPWKFYGYGNVDIPIDTELEIVPSVKKEGAIVNEGLADAVSYAFYGIAKGDGRVTSWRQASAGLAEKLIKANDPKEDGDEPDAEERYEEVKYDVSGTRDGDTLRMKITDPKVMVVVCNQPASPSDVKMYAYGFFDLTDNPYSQISKPSFDLNKNVDTWFSDPWNITLERPRVVE